MTHPDDHPSRAELSADAHQEGLEAAQKAIVASVDDRLRFNVAAYGMAWTGESGDTEFICSDAGQKAIDAYLEALNAH